MFITYNILVPERDDAPKTTIEDLIEDYEGFLVGQVCQKNMRPCVTQIDFTPYFIPEYS